MDKFTQAMKILAALDEAFRNFQYLLATKTVPNPDNPLQLFASDDGKAKHIVSHELALLVIQGMHTQIREAGKLFLESRAEGSTPPPTIGHLEAERVILDLKDKLEDYLERCDEISQQQVRSEVPQETPTPE